VPSFEAGKWLYYLVWYFVALFLVISLVTAVDYTIGLNSGISTTSNRFFEDSLNQNLRRETCQGKSAYLRTWIFGVGDPFIPCYLPDMLASNTTCNDWQGCTWNNISATCLGRISNQSLFNMSDSAAVCRDDLMQERYLCEGFGCQWANMDAHVINEFDITGHTYQAALVNNIVEIVSFRADFNLGGLVGFLVSFTFFYIEFLAFLWALKSAIW